MGKAVGSGSAVASRVGSTVVVAAVIVGEGSVLCVADGSDVGASKVARSDASSLLWAVVTLDTASTVLTASCTSSLPSEAQAVSDIRIRPPNPIIVERWEIFGVINFIYKCQIVGLCLNDAKYHTFSAL